MNTNGTDTLLRSLCALYGRHGYSRYKMNKFEEYDLYARHKDFLVSDSVMTFTDGRGKLLALKPDVTLSIVRNSSVGTKATEKLYYNENVYRADKSSGSFREIMQVGLECIGDIDGYCLYETMRLALGSMRMISDRSILAVSHLGVVTETMDGIGVPQDRRREILRYIGGRNMHDLSSALDACGVEKEKAALLTGLLQLRGSNLETVAAVGRMLDGIVRDETLKELESVMKALGDDGICLDFSVTGDINYYNGFVFQGFADGIPSAVLYGGQYDMLMKKMGKKAGAIGFAVYLDLLESMNRSPEYDFDTALIYRDGDSIKEIEQTADRLRESGSVTVVRELPARIRCRRTVYMGEDDGRNA